MNPLAEAWLRRHWPALVSLVVLALFTLVHQLWFQPTAQRYARALKAATDLGMPLDPNNLPRIMPPRLFARIADNSLPEARAQEAANSGQLTAELLGDLSSAMSRRGLTVTGTDPSPTSNNEHSILLRAHVRARGRYADFVMLLDDLARDTRLYSVDRFTMMPDGAGGIFVELWASRLVLPTRARS
jgi:hypothetical protein